MAFVTATSYKVKKLITHPLISGSAVMIIGTNLANVINYIYHLAMGRVLGPTAYGELSTLISLVGLIGVVALALNLVIVKYVSSGKNDAEISRINSWFSQKVLIIAVGILLSFSLLAPVVSSFLKINSISLLILAGLFSSFSLLSTKNKAVLQGVLKFNKVVTTLTVENSVKLILGVILVYLGFQVLGAMIALVLAPLLGWLISRHFLTAYSQSRDKYTPKISAMILYSLPVFIQSIATTSLYSTDLVLVKHFFSSSEAGIYAAVSTLGKIIYFGAGPIGMVMFPIVAKKKAQGQSYQKVFTYSLFVTVAISLVVLGAFKFSPQLTVVSLYGSSYLGAVNLLVLFGVFMALFTLSMLIINFHLSLHRTRVAIFPLVAAIVQIGGIWILHQTLSSVITVSVIVTSFLLLSLLLYTFIKPDR